MAYQKKLVYFVAAFCLIGINVFGAPNPKTVVVAGENEVNLGSSANAEAGAGAAAVTNAPPPPPQSPGHGLRKPGPNLYNDIFNIPTSILGAVSRLLSNGGSAVGNAFASVGSGSGGVHVGGQKQPGIGASVSIGGGDGGLGTRLGGGGDGGIGAEAGVSNFGAGASAGIGGIGASAGVGTGGVGAGFGGRPTGGAAQGFFNDIFNIPITALNAVNQLLNNNQKASSG